MRDNATSHTRERQLVSGVLRQHGAGDRYPDWEPGDNGPADMWRQVRQTDPFAPLTAQGLAKEWWQRVFHRAVSR